MKDFSNIQPSINPKPLKVQRVEIRHPNGVVEALIFKNVLIDPRDLIKKQ